MTEALARSNSKVELFYTNYYVNGGRGCVVDGEDGRVEMEMLKLRQYGRRAFDKFNEPTITVITSTFKLPPNQSSASNYNCHCQ